MISRQMTGAASTAPRNGRSPSRCGLDARSSRRRRAPADEASRRWVHRSSLTGPALRFCAALALAASSGCGLLAPPSTDAPSGHPQAQAAATVAPHGGPAAPSARGSDSDDGSSDGAAAGSDVGAATAATGAAMSGRAAPAPAGPAPALAAEEAPPAYWVRYLEWKVSHQNLLRALDERPGSAAEVERHVGLAQASLASLREGIAADEKARFERLVGEYSTVRRAVREGEDRRRIDARLKSIETEVRRQFQPPPDEASASGAPER